MGSGSSTTKNGSANGATTSRDVNGSATKSNKSTLPKWATRSSKPKGPTKDTRTPEQKRAAWVHFQRELPRSKSDEDKERRIQLFEKWDITGRGSLTLREVYDGCKTSLFLQDFTPRLPDIVERAFHKAKDMGNKVEGAGDEDMVEFLEFRLMLCYIYDYFKLTEMFDEMDASGNMLISPSEFARAKPNLESWGLYVGDSATTFRKIDTNGSGQITFDEFAAWAQKQKKEMDSEYGTASRSVSDANTPAAAAAPQSAQDGEPQTEAYVNPSAAQRRAAWERIRAIIPRQKTPEDKARRIELFKQFDADNSGALTLSETYKGCVLILHLDEFTPRLKDIVKRAYKKARSMGTITEGAGDAHQVEFLEFRLMLCYIYDYFELTVMFDEIDASGNGLIDRNEFRQAAPRVAEWGVVMNNPDEVFNHIDDNQSGQITFDEFAAWATAVKLDVDGDPDNVQ